MYGPGRQEGYQTRGFGRPEMLHCRARETAILTATSMAGMKLTVKGSDNHAFSLHTTTPKGGFSLILLSLSGLRV